MNTQNYCQFPCPRQCRISAHAVLVIAFLVCVLAAGCSKEQQAARKHAKALEKERQKAEQGDAETQFFLGASLVNEQSLEDFRADYAEGAKWLRRAAEQGHLEAQVALAGLLENGKPEVAKEMIVQSKELLKGTTVEPVMEILTKNRQPHAGFPAAPKEAARWYRRAAERGHIIAQVKLAQMYLDGRGVERDGTEALRWYLVASRRNAEAKGQADRLRAELTADQVAEAEKRSAAQ
jgi:uncharacterized protein